MSDILKKLEAESNRLYPRHQRDGHGFHSSAHLLDTAAAEIQRLRAELAALQQPRDGGGVGNLGGP